MLCRLFDEHYYGCSGASGPLQSTRQFRQASDFLQHRRAGKERRALEFENGVTEKILMQYQESCVSEVQSRVE